MAKLWANEKGEGVGFLGIVLLIVLVIILAGIGFLAYKHFHKSNNVVNGYVPTSSNNVTTSSNTANQSQTSKTSTSNTAASATSVVKFTQLGVQITVPTSIKDLIYKPGANTTTPTATTAILSTTALATLDPACGVDSTKTAATIQGIGELFEYSGKFTATTNPDKTSVWAKQFPNFYVAYNAPASACSKTASTNTVATTDASVLKTALTSMTTISQ